VAGVAFALDGLVDGSDGGTCTDVERGSCEEIKEFRFHVVFEIYF
jgi:hypothetical protein